MINPPQGRAFLGGEIRDRLLGKPSERPVHRLLHLRDDRGQMSEPSVRANVDVEEVLLAVALTAIRVLGTDTYEVADHGLLRAADRITT
jgi:hypothetical protein